MRNTSDDDLEEIGFNEDEGFNRYSRREEGSNSWVGILVVVILCIGGYLYFVGTPPTKPETPVNIISSTPEHLETDETTSRNEENSDEKFATDS